MVTLSFSNKTFYTLVLIFSFALLSLGVYAYNSGFAPNIFGHSGEEISVNMGDGSQELNDALSDLNNRISQVAPSGPLEFELRNDNLATYECKSKNLVNICSDGNGCTIRVFATHELSDEVRVTEQMVYIEQDSWSKGNDPAYNVRLFPSNHNGWLGVSTRRHSFDLLGDGWLSMQNYPSHVCQGIDPTDPLEAYTDNDRFKMTFIGHPHISLKVQIFD